MEADVERGAVWRDHDQEAECLICLHNGWLTRLQTECEKTVKFFSTLPESAWQVQIYSEEDYWKITQVLGALRNHRASFISLVG